MTGYIYRLYDCRNNMSYIGQTVRIYKRIKEHLISIRSEDEHSKVYNYFKDVPDWAIKFEVLEVLDKCDKNELNTAEKKYIEMYDTFRNGLNSTPGGNAKYRAENPIAAEVYNRYINGESIASLAIAFDYSYGAMYSLIKEYKDNNGFNEDRRSKSINTNNKPIALICYDTEFNILFRFKSMIEAIKWLGCSDSRNAYSRIRVAAHNGNIAYGYRWAILDSLIYNNMTFNTIFDIEAYKLGGKLVKNSNGLFEVQNDKVNKCRHIETNNEDNIRYCKKCGAVISKYSLHGLCTSCVDKNGYKDRQVPPDLKISYPFIKEELQQLYPKYTANSIAKHCGVSYTTVNKWLKNFGLK